MDLAETMAKVSWIFMAKDFATTTFSARMV